MSRRQVVLAALLLAAACRGDGESPRAGPRDLHLLPVGLEAGDRGTVAWVEVAADPRSRETGLMWRERLEPDHGMLFVYPTEMPLGFWMKNTRIPLSIAYADASGGIVSMLDMRPGAGQPDHLLPRYESGAPALYALEMEKGWFAAHGIEVGDRLRLHPDLAALPAR